MFTLICIKWVSGDPSTIFLVTTFTQKISESISFMYFSILMLENIWDHHFTWSGLNSQKIVTSGPHGPTIGIKFTISCELGPHQVKWWCHMFSYIKKEEYMEFKLSGKFE